MGVPLRIGRSVAWPTQNSSGTIKPGLGLGGYDEYDVRVGMQYVREEVLVSDVHLLVLLTGKNQRKVVF